MSVEQQNIPSSSYSPEQLITPENNVEAMRLAVVAIGKNLGQLRSDYDLNFEADS